MSLMSRPRPNLALVACLLTTSLVGCGSEDSPGGAAMGVGGTPMGMGGYPMGAGGNLSGVGGSTLGAGGLPNGAGGFIASGGASAGGAPASGGQGMGGMNAGGMAMGAGGMVVEGAGGDMPGAGGGGTVSGGDPIIPDPAGQCPNFVSGTQNILGLNTTILAGAPGATPGPLLFNWHGTGGNGQQAMGQLPQSVRDDIVAQGGIIIAPWDDGQVREGQDVTVVLGVWYDVADLGYADNIVGCAVQNHNIDPKRIYVTGCSAGGLMAGAMAALRSNYIAAAAPNSGGNLGMPALQDPTRVPAAMAMHGGTGDNVIVNFGDTSHTFEQVMTAAGSSMVIDCDHGRGHCGAPGDLYQSAWEFMKAHPFGVAPSPYAGGLPASFPSYCQIVQ